jgi:NADPH:quinone reductase-like Zn-dependent oxidoreductase
MRLGRKILIGAGALLVIGIAALAITISWTSPCADPPPVAAGTPTMRAVTQRCYGEPAAVLRVENIERPEPGDSEVLIKVHVASVNPLEWHFTTGKPYLVRAVKGIGAPTRQRVGYDVAGTVVAVGANVTRFKPGDEVFGGVRGALAEYVIAAENGDLAIKPASVSFEQVAALPIAAVTALQALRDHGHVTAGQKVLINGGSGGVGTYAVQLAKHFGAEVTAVCSTRNVALVRSIGADRVIDYTREDFTTGPEQYDLLVDTVGNHGILDLKDVVKPGGRIVGVGGPKDGNWLGPILHGGKRKLAGIFIDQEAMGFIASVKSDDLEFLAGLLRDGRMTSVIDRRYGLEQTPRALDYIGSRRARGKVLVNLVTVAP